MTAHHIAILALLVSAASLGISILALVGDRHMIQVRAVAVVGLDGIPDLDVTVSNSGKRAISINHVLIRTAGHPGLYINFSSKGNNRIDVGDSRNCRICPQDLPVTWSTVEELHKLEVFVEDAIGQRHKAVFQGKKRASPVAIKLLRRQ